MSRRDTWQNEEWLAGFMARTGRGIKGETTPAAQQAVTPQAILVRQSSRDKRNRLEKAFESDVLYWQKLRQEILRYKSEGVCLKLANGVRYTPDYYVVRADGGVTCFEIKGEKRKGRVVARDDAVVKIKIAAKEFPEVRFVLTWKDSAGAWQEQEVKEVDGENS